MKEFTAQELDDLLFKFGYEMWELGFQQAIETLGEIGILNDKLHEFLSENFYIFEMARDTDQADKRMKLREETIQTFFPKYEAEEEG